MSHSSLHTSQLSESINLIISQFASMTCDTKTDLAQKKKEEKKEEDNSRLRAQRQLQIDAATCCRYSQCCASSSTSTAYQLSVGDTRSVSNDIH